MEDDIENYSPTVMFHGTYIIKMIAHRLVSVYFSGWGVMLVMQYIGVIADNGPWTCSCIIPFLLISQTVKKNLKINISFNFFLVKIKKVHICRTVQNKI